MKAPLITIKDFKKSTIDVSDAVFGFDWNSDLVHQVVTAIEANLRQPIAHVRERDEVSGGGKKPWRQKGTGRARHGSIRSPLWIGGGKAHGPRNFKDYSKKVNRKMRSRALSIVLSQKLRDDQIVFIDDFGVNDPKTAHAKNLLSGVSSAAGKEGLLGASGHAILVVTSEANEVVKKSVRNFGNVSYKALNSINARDILLPRLVVFVGGKDAASALEERVSPKVVTK